MLKALKRMFGNVKGAIDITSVVVDVVLVTALIPVIKTFISSATNLTATEIVLLSLVSLFIVIALVMNIVKQSGLTSKR
jgi:hypothetical protein